MNEKHRTYAPGQRLLAFVLAFVMILGYVPNVTLTAKADSIAPVTTVNDPYVEVNSLDTLIYGNNTKNAGKVTVDKNVIDDNESITLSGVGTLKPSTDNFLVQVSQSAQVMALSREIPVPIDAVFVLDTSGSMNQGGKPDRAKSLVAATNSAIATLMAANDDNRVGVVAFSSENYGRGTSNYAAANVLSDLAHYKDDAASAHLTLEEEVRGKDENVGEGVQYVVGRKTNSWTYNWREENDKMTTSYDDDAKSYSGKYAARDAHNGGTNIQAGIALGAKMLTSVSKADTTVTYGSGSTSRTVTRMPVLIIVSDGCPTFSPSDSAWYDPAQKGEVGPGNAPFEGEAFLTALTAAYYKGLISEHYYEEEASQDQRCSIYTVGVDITTNNGYMNADEKAQAEFALNPSANAVKSNAWNPNYYTYGNSWNDMGKVDTYAPETYWSKYTATTPEDFDVRTRYYTTQYGQGVTEYYTVTAASIKATRNYVNGISSENTQMYTGGIGYNDEYFSASNSDLNDQFSEMIMKIQLKAMSMPTQIEEAGENFSGYVTFVDTIGEFMEVKDMKGIYADGVFYQGISAARGLQNNDSDFISQLAEAMDTRFQLTGSTNVSASSLIASARASENQAYWKSNTDYDNSIVWWGNAYTDGGTLENRVQCLAFADDDSIEYIKQQAANAIPAGADVVGRSYFFYGEADGSAPNPNHEYLFFVVRVMRSLSAPYQQTVTISAPASLLSVDKVLVNEKLSNNKTDYTVMLENADVARVIYEVGLRSDINAGNVASVVAAEMPGYATEEDAAGVSENYTERDKTFHFFTNDWDRSQTLDSHHRAMSQAIFEAAEDNDFYIYQENTYLVDANGRNLKSASAGTAAYIERVVYTWNPGTQQNSDGTYNATRSVEKIPVTIRDTSILGQDTKGVYIKAGTHAESTLAANGYEDTAKEDNATDTAAVVRHPHYSGSGTPHYTVLLGNNGKLSLKYEAPKTVSILNSAEATGTTDDDGKAVMVGQYLEYKIKATNSESQPAKIVITDSVPAGTKFVGFAGNYMENGVRDEAANKLTWTIENVGAGQSVTVSFKVQVTEEAVSTTGQIGDIQNTATIKIGNNPSYTTNTTENPPEGKMVTDGTGNELTTPEDSTYPNVKVGDELTYYIQWANDAVDANGDPAAATVTVTDVIPAGTTFHSFTGNQAGTYDPQTKTVTWTLADRAPGATGYVSFKVTVNADAVTANKITNTATIKVGPNDPGQSTNPVTVTRDTGAMSVKKLVKRGNGIPSDVTLPDTEFTFLLLESTGTLNGKFQLNAAVDGIEFINGAAKITGVNNGETFVISGLPKGATISVTENVMQDWVMNHEACKAEGTTFVSSVTVDENTGKDGTNDTAVDVTITNCYHPTPVTFQLKGTKHYVGQIPAGTTFSFTAQRCNADGTVISTGNTGYASTNVQRNELEKGKLETEDVFSFTPRAFYEETGENPYYYKITETTTNSSSMIMDTTEYMLKLEIVRVNGQLTAKASIATQKVNNSWTGAAYSPLDWANNTTTVSFTNIAPTPAVVNLNVTKTLQNRHLTDSDTFTFSLYQGAQGAGGKLIETAQNGTKVDDNSRTYAFNPLSITWADMEGAEQVEGQWTKTFTYFIYENDTGIADVTYDPSVYKVDVVVTLNEEGALVPSVTYTKYASASAADSGASADAVTFINTFVDGATVSLKGKKIIENTSGTAVGNFEFGIFEKKGESYSATPIAGSAYNATNGEITFGDLDYTLADFEGVEAVNNVKTITREYQIREIIPGASAPTFDPFMDYDETTYDITVTVTLNTVTGEMEAKVSGATTNNFQFTNTKYPSTVSVTPEAKKNVEGANVPEGLSFSFNVYAAEVENGTVKYDNVAGTGTSAVTTKVETPPENEPAATGLDEDTTKTDGTGEDTTKTDGTGEDTTKTDGTGEDTTKTNGTGEDTTKTDGTGEDTTKTNGTGEDTTKTDGTGEDTTKTDGTGEDTTKTDGAGENTIMTTDAGTGDPSGEEKTPSSASANPEEDINAQSSKNPNEGLDITFTSLVFGLNDVGTHYFLIEEVPVAGITCDTSKYLMEVKIQHINGQLTVPEGYPKYYLVHDDDNGLTQGQEVENVVFTNIYSETTLPLNLTARKKLDGGLKLGDNDFDFVLKDAATQEIVATAKNVGETVTFGSLVYSNKTLPESANGEWEFTYIMEEVEPAAAKIPGVTYDNTQYEVVVKVQQTKVGEGEVGDLTATLHSVAKIVSADNKVTVPHDDMDTGVTFENTYKPESAEPVTIAGKKVLLTGNHGRQLIAGEFSFELYRVTKNDKNQDVENLIASATNDVNGNFSFTRPYTVEGLSALMGNAESTIINYRIKEVETGLRSGVTPVNTGYSVDVAVVVKHDKDTAEYTVESVTYTGRQTDSETGVASGEPVELYLANTAADQENAGTKVKFYNKYTPKSAYTTLTGTKTLETAKEAIKENQFSFQVIELEKQEGALKYTPIKVSMGGIEIDKQVASGGTSVGTGVTEANTTSTAPIIFTNIHYTHGGEYYYEIREVNSGEAGYTYDPTVHYVKIVVDEDTDAGTLSIGSTAYYTDATFTTVDNNKTEARFTNHYGPGEVTAHVGAELELTKNVTVLDADGKPIATETYPIAESEFDFVVWNDGKQVMEGTTEPDADGKDAMIRFGTLTFKSSDLEGVDPDEYGVKTKVFNYTITEKNPNEGKQDVTDPMTYDGDTVYFTITVTDDGYGNMTATPAITDASWNADATNAKDSFDNTIKYTANTPLTLHANKVLQNKALKETDEKFDKFTFVLKENGVQKATAVNDKDGNVAFGAINYSAPGTHVYTIEEAAIDENQVNGSGTYTKSNAVYTVVVKVTADRYRTLIATPTYYSNYVAEGDENNVTVAAPAIFTNSYTPSPIAAELSAAIGATKQITGADDLPLDGFQFKVTDSSGNPVKGIDQNEQEVDIIGTSDSEGNINFNAKFQFNASGVYHYYVTESGNYPGYTTDPATWSVYVTVNYNMGPDVIENVIDGEDGKAEAGELYIQESNIFAQRHANIIQTQDVEMQSGDGEAQPQANEKPVFTNVYNPDPTSVTITANKVFKNVGENGAKRELKGGEFKFFLVDNATLLTAAEAYNDADGNVTFTINYTAQDMSGSADGKTKVFNYTMKESIPENAPTYIVFDKSPKTASVNLTVTESGALSASVKSDNEAAFTNTYKATEAKAQITATKSLAGLKLENVRFNFNLVEGQVQKDDAGKVTVVDAAGKPIDLSKVTPVQTTVNDDSGKVIFNLTYSLDDLEGAASKTYNYVLYEVAGDLDGMTYDTTAYPVTVTVTDDLKGTLSAAVAYGEDGQSAAPIIYNSYQGRAQIVALEAVKALSAPNSKTITMASKSLNGKFSFQLLTKNADGSETILETVKNQAKLDKQGNVVDYSAVRFSSIAFEEAGTYTYYIREVKGDLPGMTYDTAERKVVVTVVQDVNDGQYDVTVDYANGDAKAQKTTVGDITYIGAAPTITNTYKMEAVKVTLEANKKLNGRTLRNGEFTFRVHDSNGTLVAEATNSKDGKIIFKDIKLPMAGTYKLTISEVRGRGIFMSYDKHTYTVTVKVSESDGVLKVDKVTYPSGKVTFVNNYNPGGPAKTGDQTPLGLLITVMVVSAAAIVILLILWKKRKNR